MRNARAEVSAWYAGVVSLPFHQFAIRAYHFHDAKSDEDAGWHSELYWFVWLLRGHPGVRHLLDKPKKAMTETQALIAGWTRVEIAAGRVPPNRVNRGDPWMDWFGVEKADAQAEFMDVWTKSRFLPGTGPLEQAADSARRKRLAPRPEIAEKRIISDEPGDTTDYGFFISLAGHLQVAVGDKPIRLPCENVSGIMGVSKMTVSRYRRWAQEDEFLTLTRHHKFRSGGGGDATEFRFDVSRFECLETKAKKTGANE